MSYVIVKFRIKEFAIKPPKSEARDRLAPGLLLAYTSDATSQMIGRPGFIRLSQVDFGSILRSICGAILFAGWRRLWSGVCRQHRASTRWSHQLRRLKDWRGVVVRLVREYCLKGEQECSSKHFSF